MKKSILALILSIGQLVIGALAIVFFIVLTTSGEEITKWIPALLLAIALVVLGSIGIRSYNAEI